MGILDSNEEYKLALPLWKQTRAAIVGKGEVLALAMDGGLCSPLYRETKTNYEMVRKRKFNYWNRAKYFNATGRTADAYGGMIWSKPAVPEWSPQMDFLNDTADGSNSLREVMQGVTDHVLATGRFGQLADTGSAEGQTMLEQERNNPRMIGYNEKQIYYVRESGDTLQEVRLHESYEEQTGEFDFEEKHQVRRLILIDGIYHNQIWRGNSKSSGGESYSLHDDITPKANGNTFKFIPFQFYGAEDNTPKIGGIPLFDLGSQNLGHFILDADNRENLHYHAQGMTNIFSSMETEEFDLANPNGLDVGAKGRNMLNQGDRVEILQLEATGALAAEMGRDEQRMIMLGAQVVQDASSNVTLGAKQMEFGASTSTLKRISENITAGAKNVLTWMQMFKGVTTPISYTLNTEFVTDSMTPEMVSAHMAAIQMGELPPSTFNETARKAGLTKLNDEEIKQAKENEAFTPAGTTEEQATIQAENEALKQELADLKAGS
jgi:hypothetical protein